MRRAHSGRSGQAAVEFAVLYAGVILPLTFMTIFVAEMLWIWHSVADFTRDGARYAVTHCWMADGSNVTGYMQSHVPAMIDQARRFLLAANKARQHRWQRGVRRVRLNRQAGTDLLGKRDGFNGWREA